MTMGSENAHMTGGDGADRFIFRNAFDTARVRDFDASDGDTMQFVFMAGAGSLQQILDNSSNRNGDLVITLPNAKIIVDNLTKADLVDSMFDFF
jgi:hypothetical protein